MLAKDTLARARTILQDETSVRWPLPELCGWLNDGLREIAALKPSAFAATQDLVLVEGVKQSLPAGVGRLLRPISNAPFAGADRYPRTPVTVTDQALLDAVTPDWHADRRKAQQVRHVMFDEASPRTFYVYPPNDGTGRLRAVVSVIPAQVVASGSPTAIDSYGAEVPIEDTYANLLLDYILYRAFSKDAQFASSIQRAAAHFQQFTNGMGVQVGAEANMSPNRKPRVAAAAPGVAANA